MTLPELKSVIQNEIERYQNDPEYDNPEYQMEIFNALKECGYDHDSDVQCVNIATKTKSGEEVFKFILKNRLPRVKTVKI